MRSLRTTSAGAGAPWHLHALIAFPALLTAMAGLTAAACGTSSSPEHDDEATASTSQFSFGQCTRDPLILRGEPGQCAVDLDCPCGSYCDGTQHRCRFTCMVPPKFPSEACATNTQCDDTGRCVPGQAPAAFDATLSALPDALSTLAGGPAKQLSARLTVVPAGLSAAQSSTVRVIGRDGALVSCDASTFVSQCDLSAWTFAFNGTVHEASRQVWVRTPAGTPLGKGAAELHLQDTGAQLVVPAGAAPASSTHDGRYQGRAFSPGIPGGLAITATIRNNRIALHDPTQAIAPDGTVLLDLVTWETPTTKRRVSWLRPLGAADTAGAIIAEVQAGMTTVEALAGSLRVPFTVALPGLHVESWTLQLAKDGEFAAQCQTNADCTNNQICLPTVQTCAPAAVSSGPPAVANQFDDPRSLAWWDAIDDHLTGGTAKPAFATTGADLIETLMCTIQESELGAGRLSLLQVMQGTGPSRSGDLACAQGAVGGAVGLASYKDRKGDAVSSALLSRCLDDLSRSVTGVFSANFALNVGECANLARFVPSLRLLATGELGKATRADRDGRGRGLFARLIQQWTSLHGFLASTGLAAREYDDATSASPAQARADLFALLDTLDAGWAALLDRRVAPMMPAASTWAPDAADAHSGVANDPGRDYRWQKLPLLYWPLNAGPQAAVDVVRGVHLGTPHRPCEVTGTCPPNCEIDPTRNAFFQRWGCPGLTTVLPAGSPSLAGNRNLTVTLSVDPLDTYATPPYGSSTLFASEELAIIQYYIGSEAAIGVVHPTATAQRHEWIPFTGFGRFGLWTNDQAIHATSFAVVRDAVNKKYTLYVHTKDPADQTYAFTLPYQHDVSGILDGMSPSRIYVGAGPSVPAGSWWAPHRGSFNGYIDDVGVLTSTMSQREFVRFDQARAFASDRRALLPTPMTLTDHVTQELGVPVGAAMLEAQAAHLDVAARLADHLRHQAHIACDGTGVDADAARTELAAAAWRLGRTLRQASVIESYAAPDSSVRAGKARQVLRAKRSALGRQLSSLQSCTPAYGLGQSEIPLYFNGSSSGDAKDKFFAASTHLQSLATSRANAAADSLGLLQARWDAARQSELQEQMSQTTRNIRVEEITERYGDGLRRLCGVTELSSADLLAAVAAGTFSIDTCFVKPVGTCRAQAQSGPIKDADPACYRGVLGAGLMDTRTASHQQQGAYQAWQAAIANAEGAQKSCVHMEMDAYGCSALDRHALTGVTCPPHHQGTVELITAYNAKLAAEAQQKSLFGAVMSAVSSIATITAATAVTGPGGAFLAVAQKSLGTLSGPMAAAKDERARQHQLALTKIGIEANIRECWARADQYERAVAVADQSSQEASSRLQTSLIHFENALGEARELATEGPVALDREKLRPTLPIAFHYWLPDEMANYRFLLETARRYTYMALRATEYDALDTFLDTRVGYPNRSAVLSAWRPQTLQQQLLMMKSLTDTRTTTGGPPSLGHIAFDIGKKFFGLTEGSSEFGEALLAHTRPVYSARGEYLGRGLAFSLVPRVDSEGPTWRCAERIWRVNFGTANYPAGSGDELHLKMLKRTTFASRKCDGDGLVAASLRPGVNLLVSAGEPQVYKNQDTNSVADLSVHRFTEANAPEIFRNRDEAYNGSSDELALQGLYGDYVLLFPAPALNAGLDVTQIFDTNLRFDFVSVDDTPQTSALGGLMATAFGQLAAAADGSERGDVRVEIDAAAGPIVVE